MKSHPQERLALVQLTCHVVGVLVLIGGGVLSYLFVFQPMYEAHAAIQSESEDCDQLLSEGPVIHRRFADLNAEVDELQVQLGKSTKRVPVGPEEAEFLAQVAQLAQMAELEIVDYQASDVLARAKHHEMTLALSTAGTYASICLFLEQLKELPRLCRVTEVKVATEQDGDVYPCEMTLTIYYGLND